MAVPYIYPTSHELSALAMDKMPRLMKDRPIFDILPIKTYDANLVSWEQGDNYVGLQQLRGLNGQPARVKPTGFKRFDFQPGVYGEFSEINEQEMTTRRSIGTFGTPINLDDLIMARQDQLLVRRLDRIELIGWTLLLTGTFTVALPYGAATGHTDAYTVANSGVNTAGIYEFNKFTPGTAWSTFGTATPLANLRSIKLLSRGHGVNFGRQATLYVNQTTMNNIMANTNNSDLAGRRTNGLATVLSPEALNQVLMGEDLPTVQVYDEGYFNDSGVFTLFIPNATGVLVGKRGDGNSIGEYQMTRNVNNPDFAPGAYMKVIDRGETNVPRTVEVHDGHNGGPALAYPGSIVVLTGL